MYKFIGEKNDKIRSSIPVRVCCDDPFVFPMRQGLILSNKVENLQDISGHFPCDQAHSVIIPTGVLPYQYCKRFRANFMTILANEVYYINSRRDQSFCQPVISSMTLKETLCWKSL